MLSLRPQTLGIYDLPTNFRVAVPEAITPAQQLQAGGYRTEAMDKMFHRGHDNDEVTASGTVLYWMPVGKPYALPDNLENRVESNNGPRDPAFESVPVEDDPYTDGKIALEVVARSEAPPPRFPIFDTNHDGVLNEEEYEKSGKVK
jgi:iduronate 2-sulfatase